MLSTVTLLIESKLAGYLKSYTTLLAPQAPGTRLAHEHHGSKAGRFCSRRTVIDGRTSYQPVRCKGCRQASVIFDERELPYCPCYGEIHEPGNMSKRIDPQTKDRHWRARGYKKFRLYGQQSYKPEVIK